MGHTNDTISDVLVNALDMAKTMTLQHARAVKGFSTAEENSKILIEEISKIENENEELKLEVVRLKDTIISMNESMNERCG